MTYSLNLLSPYPILSLVGNLTIEQQSRDLIIYAENNIFAKHNKIVIDLKDLNYLNSSGLGALITLLTKARKAGGDVVISNINEAISKLLVITKLNTVFIVANTNEEAIELLVKA